MSSKDSVQQSNNTSSTLNGGVNEIATSTSNRADNSFDKTSLVEKNIYQFDSDKMYGVWEPIDAKSKLPGSLFYEAQSSEDGRSGLFNYYVLGNLKSGSGGSGKLNYIKSETFSMNKAVTPEISRNPTAHNIIKTTTSSGAFIDPSSPYVSQPYNVKDFIFCKHYGVIPNNRMITLRRFPTAVMDNLRVPVPGPRPELVDTGGNPQAIEVMGGGITRGDMTKTGAAQPVAQAVTFFGEGTGNRLEDILGITTGLNWRNPMQKAKIEGQGNDRGFLDSSIGQYVQGLASAGTNKNLQGISNLIGAFTDPDNVQQRVQRTFFDKLTSGDGPLSQRIFVDVNTVDKLWVRERGFSGGATPFKLTFTYTLTSVGTINSRMLFIDLLANLLAIGTDYGKFLTPQFLVLSSKQGIGFPMGSKGYVKSLLQPVEFLNDMLDSNWSALMKSKKSQLEKQVAQGKTELEGLKKGTKLPKDGVIYKTLSAMLTSDLINQIKYEPIMLSGYPTGEWHVVVGNPLNPIAMMGNLICNDVSIKLNNVLGPDDFPTEMTATYTLQPARQKHRGDFESMFNRGNGRLYLGKVNYSDQAKNVYRGAVSGNDPNQSDLKDIRTTGTSYTNTGID
jgi:hypothetical protein